MKDNENDLLLTLMEETKINVLQKVFSIRKIEDLTFPSP